MLKILQARLQQYVNQEFPDVQYRLSKAEEPEIKLPTSAGSSKKQENSKKTYISALLTMPKPLTVWITINCGGLILKLKLQYFGQLIGRTDSFEKTLMLGKMEGRMRRG